MRRLALLSSLVAVFAVAAPIDDYPPYNTAKKLYAKNDLRGKKAPEFVVEEWLSGAAPEMKDKIVVIDFWATWCPPCRDLIPKMNKWAEKYKDDIVFVGISDEKKDVVTKFMETTKIAYPSAIDTQERMSKVVGVEGIPHALVITPDGIVRWQGFPGDAKDPLTEQVLDQIIKASKASR